MYNKCHCANRFTVGKSPITSVIGVAGNITNIEGECLLPVKVGTLQLWQKFHILPGNSTPEIILGEDFLSDQRAVWDFATGVVTLQDGLVSVSLECGNDKHNTVCFVKTKSEVVIPAYGETLLPVHVHNRKDCNIDSVTGVIDPAASLQIKHHVVGAKCTVVNKHGDACYRLLNPLPVDRVIPQRTILGTFTPVDCSDVTLVHMASRPECLTGVDHIDSEASTLSKDSNLNPLAPEFVPKQSEANVNSVNTVSNSNSMVSAKECDGGSCVAEMPTSQPTHPSSRNSKDPSICRLDVDHMLSLETSSQQASVMCCQDSDQGDTRQGYIERAMKLNLDIPDTLKKEDRRNLLAVIGKHADVFSTSETDIGMYPHYQHVIDTGDHDSVKARFYRHSPAQKIEIEKIVNNLMSAGIVERSTSDWLSPVVLVKKSNGSWRLTIDYRAINRLVKPIYFPLPRHADVTDSLGQAKPTVFTTIDLAQAFLQIQLDPTTKHKTAFTTHHGVFQFRRLPQGFAQSPSVFSSVLAEVLAEIQYVYALVYADDILVFSRDVKTHIQHLDSLFTKLKNAKLKVRADKCQFMRTEVKFLGHLVNKDGLKPSPTKTAAVTTFPEPTNKSQLRSFIGLCQYYRRFVRNFAKIASPLTALLAKDADFKWNEECQKAFDLLKQHLSSPPILAVPDFNKEFYLMCDASATSIGYILGQKDDNGREVVIEYGGRSLHKNEKKWHITQLEALAVIEGVKHFHIYLVDKPFTIYTDHAALQHLQNVKLDTGRLCRWSLFMQQYRYIVKYRRGKLNSNADALSRREYNSDHHIDTTGSTDRKDQASVKGQETQHQPPAVSQVKNETDNDARCIELNALRHIESVMNVEDVAVPIKQENDADLAPLLDYLSNGTIPQGWHDKDVKRLITEANDYVIDPEDGILYHLYYSRGKGPQKHRVIKQLVVPQTLKHDVMLSYHDALMAGHQGFDRTYHLIRLKYFWKGMYAEIKEYVSSCHKCQVNKRTAHPQNYPLKPLPCEGIFRRLHIDVFGPLPQVGPYRYVLVIVCAFSKWPECFPLKSLTGAEVAHILYNEIICRWGAPYSLLSDRGTNFLSSIVKEVCKLFHIQKLNTSAWHPETNGTVERRMSTLAQTLRMFINANQSNWPDILPSIMAAMRATPATNTTLFSPYKILLGEEMRLPLDTRLIPNKSFPQNTLDHLQQITSQFDITREVVKDNIKTAQERNKVAYDRGSVNPSYRLGDLVLINNVTKKKGLNPKLCPKKNGPYYIADVDAGYNTYLLRDSATHKQLKSRVHAKRLTLYRKPEDRRIQPPQNPTPDAVQEQQADVPPAAENDSASQPPVDSGPGDQTQSQVTSSPDPMSPDNGRETTNPEAHSQPIDPNSIGKLLQCQNYKGCKWYKTKFNDGHPSRWVREDLLPQILIREFHVTKTQKGQARKAKKANKA